MKFIDARTYLYQRNSLISQKSKMYIFTFTRTFRFFFFFYRSLSLGIIKLFEKRDGIDWPETGD